MKTFSIALVAAASVAAAPTDYTPAGGWESVNYPADAGANMHEYPAPPGGWESVNYPAGTGASASGCAPSLADKLFTSTYHVTATPDQVVNSSNVATGGLAGATGQYDFGINSASDLICWYIELRGFRGDYSSPAKTATHIHEAAKGKNGPPRIAFPNPSGNGDVRTSKGCMTGPFTTGVMANGKDSGEGFKLSQIEQNPAMFFADVHSSLAVPGAVRGQLA